MGEHLNKRRVGLAVIRVANNLPIAIIVRLDVAAVLSAECPLQNGLVRLDGRSIRKRLKLGFLASNHVGVLLDEVVSVLNRLRVYNVTRADHKPLFRVHLTYTFSTCANVPLHPNVIANARTTVLRIGIESVNHVRAVLNEVRRGVRLYIKVDARKRVSLVQHVPDVPPSLTGRCTCRIKVSPSGRICRTGIAAIGLPWRFIGCSQAPLRPFPQSLRYARPLLGLCWRCGHACRFTAPNVLTTFALGLCAVVRGCAIIKRRLRWLSYSIFAWHY